MRKLLICWVIAGLTLLTGCGGGGSSTPAGGGGGTSGGQVTLQSITVSPSTASIAQGTTQAFTAMGNYSDGSSKDLTLLAQWSCLIPTVATVSNNSPTQGLATAVVNAQAVTPANALITATMGTVSGSATLTAKSSAVFVTSVVISPSNATIGFGEEQQFTATATFSDMSQQDVTNASSWLTFPPFITSNSGLAIGQNVGTGNMVFAITPGGGSGMAMLSVDLSKLVSVAISPAPLTVANNTQVPIYAIGTFVDGSTRDLSSMAIWNSSNFTMIVNVIGNTLSVATTGTTTLTADVCTITDPVTFLCTASITSSPADLTVSAATLQSVAVYPANATIAPTTKLNLHGIGGFSDGSTEDLTSLLTWSSSDTAVASASSKAVATGLAMGTTNLSGKSKSTLGSIQGATPLTVTAATLNSIAVMPANAFITPGDNIGYSAIGTFSDGSTQDVTAASTWSSKTTTVATVVSNLATGQGMGQSTIQAKLGSVTGTTMLRVASPQQISLAVAPATIQIAEQTAAQLLATGTLGDGSTQDFTTGAIWTSSNPTVATIGAQTGIVTAIGAGTSTITATLGSVSSTTVVTVTNASLTSITISPANASITLGNTQQLTAAGMFSDGSSQVLVGATWNSSIPTSAVVDGSGLAVGTGQGTAKITATLNGITGTTNLTVN